ncbi:olfactory receptor 6Y1 [Pithys albifrons albifrons]|uniref:olfactory receptor 6Y1 n=1 Tax=Pithys albifrons albifrons TaxID=3385563 RepID=UPI003A5CDDB2
MGGRNETKVMYFIFLGFPTTAELQLLPFSALFLAYVLTVLENFLIICIIRNNDSLKKPMCFFLGNLSFLGIWYVSVTESKMLINVLSYDKHITFQGCITVLYFFVTFVCTEYILLAVTAYDCFLTICKPLRYSLMNHQFCAQLIAGCWMCGLITSSIKLSLIAQLSLCDVVKINHYFCDISPLLNISCSDSPLAELVDFILALIVIRVPLCTVVTFCICIMFTVLKIPSSQGSQKAFSTCSSHLIVVILFYSTTLFTYAYLKLMYTYSANKLVSVLYTVIVPLLNPLIYCLRNKEVRYALRKTFTCTRHT